MQKLIIDLEYCYGIKKLQTEFDFSQDRTIAIYAANGAMKSSLAETFKDVAQGTFPKDRIFPARKTKSKITDENGIDLPPDQVVVIRPYDEGLGHSEKTSTLLVNSALRKEYETLLDEIDKSKETFLKSMKVQSGSKKNIEKVMSGSFTSSEDEFFIALIRIKEELLSQTDAPFATLSYDRIFDEKVLAFLSTKDFKTAIQEYITKYNELLSASMYFKKGIFNYYNAATIAKSLADNGFFDAKHTVSLNASTKTEITTQSELEELIAKEKDGISKNEALKKKFAEIEKQLNKNVNLREFHGYLQENEGLLPKLANIEKFREEIWKSYFKVQIDLYKDLVDKYQAAEERKRQIEAVAAKERTQWESVIQIFNDRFYVPFKLTAKNRTAVILGQEPLLILGFTFEEGDDKATIEKKDLINVLSTGEKKALYVLSIIFEVEARKKLKQETVFVVDDVADSFDYKNKYAIVEYLRDISEQPHFRQIILTHNFDFFRTINSRFVKYKNCLMAFKSSKGLTLDKAAGIKNIFVNDWKPNFFEDPKKKIASIPFIRNIIEYTKGDTDPEFLKLTSLLHCKTDSPVIKQSDLDDIFNSVFGGTNHSDEGDKIMMKVIHYTALECLNAVEGVNFENKIVLSIAIRTAAESFMIKKINDTGFVSSIDANQTIRLFVKYKELHSSELDKINTLQRVMLMTPESIHLNSFMYEPILDMSDEHLKKLYQDVLALS